MEKQSIPTILYVDDEIINLKLFKITYESDFNTITAESGFEGLEILKGRDIISLVISDMKMPLMNGLEFIKKLKENKPHIPCLILSGYKKTMEISKAIEDEIIVEYFMKPFDKTELKGTINNLIKTNTNTR